jgi:hypothetical protein
MAAETGEHAFGKVLAPFPPLRCSLKLRVPQGSAAGSNNEGVPSGGIKSPAHENSGHNNESEQDQQSSNRDQGFRAELH